MIYTAPRRGKAGAPPERTLSNQPPKVVVDRIEAW